LVDIGRRLWVCLVRVFAGSYWNKIEDNAPRGILVSGYPFDVSESCVSLARSEYVIRQKPSANLDSGFPIALPFHIN